ncbi:hypothetical protein ACISU4_19600 [Streptomyces wuyuanensis]|uniref:hypothetical protein n=1 Tax=Streptomyces wuyuanensis TaxID=1196353 RepID=UPI0038045560
MVPLLYEHRGRRPVVPESAYVAPSASCAGAVVLGERARVLHGAVLTAEGGTSMRTVMAGQAAYYGAHRDDRRLDG